MINRLATCIASFLDWRLGNLQENICQKRLPKKNRVGVGITTYNRGRDLK